MTGGDAARVGVLIDDIRTVIAAANPEASEIMREALETAYREGWEAGWYSGDDSGAVPSQQYITEDWLKSEALSSICKGEQ
jgi:hypothetical protein